MQDRVLARGVVMAKARLSPHDLSPYADDEIILSMQMRCWREVGLGLS